MLSGILGDVLVVEFDTSLKVLMWISAAFVWAGFVLGFFVLRPPTSNLQPNNRFWSDTQNQTSIDGQYGKHVDIQPGISRATDSDVESRRTAESKSSQNPLVSEEHDILSEQNREVISNPRHYFNSAVENSSHSVVHEHDGGKVDMLAEPGFRQPSSESVRNLSAEPISSSYLTMQGKMRLFFRQVRCLRHSLKSGVVQAMLLYWIFGNAVFQVSFKCVHSSYDFIILSPFPFRRCMITRYLCIKNGEAITPGMVVFWLSCLWQVRWGQYFRLIWMIGRA